MIAAEPDGKGTDRLLAAVGRLDGRPPGSRRLADAVGGELARMLVFALSGAHGLRARGLRGRSSP